jgi:mRNA interferase MazF
VRLEPSAENGLDKVSAADAFQVRSVAQERFVKRVGKLSDKVMQYIVRALAFVLNLEP